MTRKEDNEEESICHDSDASSSKSKIPKAKIIKTILKSLAVCGVTHVLADVIFRRVLGKRYHQFSKTDQIYLAERIPSTMHGLGVGLAALYVIFVKKAFKHGVFQPYPLVLDHVFAASVGYTIYDMVTMLFQEQPVEMWIHHVLSLLGTLLMVRSIETRCRRTGLDSHSLNGACSILSCGARYLICDHVYLIYIPHTYSVAPSLFG